MQRFPLWRVVLVGQRRHSRFVGHHCFRLFIFILSHSHIYKHCHSYVVLIHLVYIKRIEKKLCSRLSVALKYLMNFIINYQLKLKVRFKWINDFGMCMRMSGSALFLFLSLEHIYIYIFFYLLKQHNWEIVFEAKCPANASTTLETYTESSKYLSLLAWVQWFIWFG